MNEFNELNDDEKLKAENDFLKLKMMLEHGAIFGSMPNSSDEFTPALENAFLRNVIEFEKKYAEQKTVKVFDKIGRPTHFKRSWEIPDDAIDNAWQEMKAYLLQRNIELSVYSPNVTNRELYRFTMEELFEEDIDELPDEGMRHCFLYDEFHPDHIYDNTNTAIDNCIRPIISKQPFKWMHLFRSEHLRLNHHFPITETKFKYIINRFKNAYDDIDLIEITNVNCIIDEKKCMVTGSYKAKGQFSAEVVIFEGNLLVEFGFEEIFEHWFIVNVQINGINF